MSAPEFRRYEAEELAEIVRCPRGWIPIEELAARLGREANALYAKRGELKSQAKRRAACGAFLPDDGLPYRARMALLLKGVS